MRHLLSRDTAGWRRSAAVLAAGAAAALAVSGVTSTAAQAAGTPLRDLAAAKGIYMGVALANGTLGSDSTYRSIAATQFNAVTPENEMKWDTIEPSKGSFNYSSGDSIVSFAQTNSDKIRGHNLVWHQQLPGWVTSLPTNQVQAAMENHITNEVTHYKGKIYAWDVVNEPFDDSGNYRTDVFYNAMGGGVAYIADALKTAHAADPAAKLYVNDYNIEGTGSKSDAMYNLVKSLKAQGAPIDGVGFESHFIVGQVPSSLKSNMQRFADLGVDVAITELDVRMPTPATSANLSQQATDYANVVNTCLAVARCVGVTAWDLDDGHSWVPGTFSGQGAATLYDSSYNPKPAYTSVQNALGAGSSTSGGTTSGTTSGTTAGTTSGTTAGTTSGTTTGTTSGTTTGTTSGTTSGTTTGTTSGTTTGTTSGTTGGTPTGCSAVYSVTSSWNVGFTANVTISCAAGSSLNGWKANWNFGAGQTFASPAWNANCTQSGAAVSCSNLSYNASVPSGGSVSFGFNGNWSGSNPIPTVTLS
ncbi:endo-1,4-beta-xylanase [Streptacidiphilus griseoplanus]|uniref:endo-1,4-beta-xylanase n=1 Tax=Peterkaempfera griseoplana TaxID=66896 RepID=UPI0006E32DF2|nr:endo-1,4-beta-xylanase [Peterkaempfera griseoplana]